MPDLRIYLPAKKRLSSPVRIAQPLAPERYTGTKPMPTMLELYEKLKPKLGEEEARSLLEFIESSVERRAATKEDLQRTASALREELQRTAAELREEIHRVESSLREEIHRVESSLRAEIHGTKVDLLKWSFAFWIGNIAVLSGMMFALLRAYGPK